MSSSRRDSTRKKLVVVFGAIGRQGGSVIRAMRSDGQFILRAVTRTPESSAAKALANQGVEVVKADMDDPESIQKAVVGAYGVFLVTSYWDVYDGDSEARQGICVVDAVQKAGVQHLVFSGTPSSLQLIGKEAPHLESKAAVIKHIHQLKIPATIAIYAFYYENFLDILKPKLNEKMEYVLDIPMDGKRMNSVCVEETGECIHQIFLRPSEFIGRTVGLVSHQATIDEYAAALTRAFSDDKKFIAGTITTEQLRESAIPGADSLSVMFELMQKLATVDRQSTMARKLNPTISTFDEWTRTHRSKISAILPTSVDIHSSKI